jgi:hypothetical protein
MRSTRQLRVTRTLDDWLRTVALPAYDAYRADPSRGLSLEEVRAHWLR